MIQEHGLSKPDLWTWNLVLNGLIIFQFTLFGLRLMYGWAYQAHYIAGTSQCLAGEPLTSLVLLDVFQVKTSP